MLRQVYIILNDNILYQRNFAKGLDISLFNNIYPYIKQQAFSSVGSQINTYDFFKYKVSYTAEKSSNLLFLFINGLTDDFEDIKLELHKLKKEFLNLFGEIITNNTHSSIFEVINPTIDAIHRSLRPKISLIGFSGVGKTTITKLIKSEEIPMTHIPTITGDIATIKIGKLQFSLWDFAGQEQFSFLWNKFIRGSDAVLLITDSALENVEKSKYFIELINEEAPFARTAILANKQDLPNAAKVEHIEDITGLKTYAMIAIDPENKNKMLQIIADVLDMNPEVSPLLKPLFKRDRLIEEAQKAIEQGEFEQTIILFEQIRDLCIELGDDSLGLQFHEKASKLKKILNIN